MSLRKDKFGKGVEESKSAPAAETPKGKKQTSGIPGPLSRTNSSSSFFFNKDMYPAEKARERNNNLRKLFGEVREEEDGQSSSPRKRTC